MGHSPTFKRVTTSPWRAYGSGWQRERRDLRMTKECGTLPSKTSRVDMFNGGAREALIATAVLVSVFVYIAGLRTPPHL